MNAEHNGVSAYERQAHETRRRLASTLDELANNLTPGRVLDEVLSYARGGGASFLKNLGNAASSNPIPVALIGISAAMFLTGRGRVGSDGPTASAGQASSAAVARQAGRMSSERSVLDDVGATASEVVRTTGSAIGDGAAAVGTATASAADAVGSAAASVAGQARSVAAETLEHAREGAAAVGGALADTSQKAADAAARGVEAAGEAVGEVAEVARKTVAETGSAVLERGKRIGADVSERTRKLVNEQPLLVAAAGLAIGAAIAAALPRTKTEDSLIGDTSDALKDAVAQVAAEQFEAAKSVANTVAEEVKKTATEGGLSPAAAAGAVRDLGDKLKEAVRPNSDTNEWPPSRTG